MDDTSLLAETVGLHILTDTYNSDPTAMSAIESALIQGFETWPEEELLSLAEELNIETSPTELLRIFFPLTWIDISPEPQTQAR